MSDGARSQLVQEAIGQGGPLAKRKAFTRADIIRVVAPRLYGYAADELGRVVTEIVRHRECVPLVGQPGARGRAWAAASVLATEQAVEAVAERLVARENSAAVAQPDTSRAIADKEAALGQSLTDGQRSAIGRVLASGRGIDLVVGVAGSGKTTALDVMRAAYEGSGYRVLGTAISGQAARTLHDEAGIASRTIASLVWRLEHQLLTLDERTVLIIDEAGMADDRAMLKLLAAVDVAGAKAIVVGDHRQLDALEPGGGLEALANRHGPAVHVLDENIRQRDPGERAALEQLRTGSVSDALNWYHEHDRIITSPTATRRSTPPSTRGKPTFEPATSRFCLPGNGATSLRSTNEHAIVGLQPMRSKVRRSKHPAASTTPAAIASSRSRRRTTAASSPASAARSLSPRPTV